MKHKLSKFFLKLSIFMIVIESIAGFMLIGPMRAQAAFTGVNTGSTFADDASIGSYTWSNPANAQNSDDQWASTDITNSGNRTHYLKATGFNFALPNDVTINGIELSVEKHQDCTFSGCTSIVTDNTVRLIKDGIVVGSNLASGVPWVNVDTTATYGSLANLWGTTWTVADINNANFGAAISATRSPGGSRTVSVDQITMKVYYTDTTAPVIAAHENITAEATSAGGAVVSYSAPVATDNIDAPAPANCLPVSGAIFPLGLTTVTCNKTDAAGNAALPITFNVTVNDTTAPVITLNGDADMVIEKGSVYTDAGATAMDAVDGDVTGKISITNTVDSNNVGVYVVSYSVSDSHGNSITKTRTVRVEDTTKPVITITRNPDKDSANITYTVSIDFDTDSVIKQYQINGGGWIDYSGVFTISTAGKYVIAARGIDLSGNTGESNTTLLIDLSVPVISGVKDGEYYNNDRVVTVTDNDVVASFTLNGAPFTSGGTINTDGNYTVVAKDNAGNTTTISFGIYKTLPLLTIEKISDNSGFSLKYDAKAPVATNVYLYVYDKKDDYSNPIRSLSQSSSTGTFTVTDLPKGVTYYFRLQTLNGIKLVGYSDVVTGYIEKPVESTTTTTVSTATPTEEFGTGGPVFEPFVPKAEAKEVTPTPTPKTGLEQPTGQTKGTEDTKDTNKPSRSRDILVIIALLAIAGAAYYGYKKLPESDEIIEPKKLKIEEKPEIKMPKVVKEVKKDASEKKKSDMKKKKGKR